MSLIRKIVVNGVSRRTYSAVFITRSYATENINSDCLKSRYADIDIPKINFTEYIINNFQQFPDKIAMQCAITERRYTYDDILVKATNFNRCLRKKLKLRKGDVVALLLPNIPEFYICVLGSTLAGLTVTTINPAYTAEEIKRQLLDSNAKAIITQTVLWKNAKTAADETRNNLRIITIKDVVSEATPAGAIDFQELANTKVDIPDVELPSPEDTVFMPYSSGTTGLPKGVQLSSTNIVANISQVTHPEFMLNLPVKDRSYQDITIAVLPLFHVYGFTTMLALMTEGTKLITVPKFTPDTYINCLRDHRPHILMLVPPMIIFLYSHPGVKTEYFSALRTVTSGAAPLGALDEEKLRQKVERPINVSQGYGLSETSPAVTMVPISLQGKFPGTLGTILPNTTIKVVDIDSGKHLGPNQTGELLVKGPQVMKGYHNRPSETQSSFLDGWFRTGDLVRYDEHHMLYIADRIKELIKVKGFQVPPAELEEIIRDFPGVAEAAVIGIANEYYGEAPRAYVIPKQNNTIDGKKLREYVDSKVAKHKRLEGGVSIVDSIPKNASGKILRRELKTRFEKEGI